MSSPGTSQNFQFEFRRSATELEAYKEEISLEKDYAINRLSELTKQLAELERRKDQLLAPIEDSAPSKEEEVVEDDDGEDYQKEVGATEERTDADFYFSSRLQLTNKINQRKAQLTSISEKEKIIELSQTLLNEATAYHERDQRSDVFVWQILYHTNKNFLRLMSFETLLAYWRKIKQRVDRAKPASTGQNSNQSTTNPNLENETPTQKDQSTLSNVQYVDHLIERAKGIRNNEDHIVEFIQITEIVRAMLANDYVQNSRGNIENLWSNFVVARNVRVYFWWAVGTAIPFLIILLFLHPEYLGGLAKTSNCSIPFICSQSLVYVPDRPLKNTIPATSIVASPKATGLKNSHPSTHGFLQDWEAIGGTESHSQPSANAHAANNISPSELVSPSESSNPKSEQINDRSNTRVGEDKDKELPPSLILAVFGGILGGSLSAIWRPRLEPDIAQSFRIPSVDITFVRPLSGGVAAIIFFLVSNSAGITFEDPIFYVASIGVGFSERALFTQLGEQGKRAQDAIDKAI